MEEKTRFIWANGTETWHKTYTAPHYPQWEVCVESGHPAGLPAGRHLFKLVKPEGGEAYYQEVSDG